MTIHFFFYRGLRLPPFCWLYQRSIVYRLYPRLPLFFFISDESPFNFAENEETETKKIERNRAKCLRWKFSEWQYYKSAFNFQPNKNKTGKSAKQQKYIRILEIAKAMAMGHEAVVQVLIAGRHTGLFSFDTNHETHITA